MRKIVLGRPFGTLATTSTRIWVRASMPCVLVPSSSTAAYNIRAAPWDLPLGEVVPRLDGSADDRYQELALAVYLCRTTRTTRLRER